MSRRADFFKVPAGEKPDRIPFTSFGFWNQAAMHTLVPAEYCDENMLPLISDVPPREQFSSEPRTQESRARAVRLGEYLEITTLGVGVALIILHDEAMLMEVI